MIFGKIFAEIFEGSDRSRTSLDFIENNQGVSRNLAAGFDFQSPQNDFRIKRIFKQRANSLVSFEVEMNEILEVSPTEFIHNPAFSHLPRAID
jgi:hypothetical protein